MTGCGARPRRPRGAAQPAGSSCSVRQACSAPDRDLRAGVRRQRGNRSRRRDIRLRPLERGAEEFSVLLVEDTRAARAGAAAQARRARPADRQHRARDPQPARRDQPCDRAAERGEARDDRERLTRIIRDNAGRLERLVSDVLQLNKRDRVSAAPVRPARLARRLRGGVRRERADCGRAHRARDAARVVDRVRPRAPAPGDVEPAAQRGALRAPEPGAIRIRLAGYADRVELSVIDNGPACRRRSAGSCLSLSLPPRRRARASACIWRESCARPTVRRSST